MQKPSLGRVVIVAIPGGREAPAMITHVWNDTLVNVRVIDEGAMPLRTSVTLHETAEAAGRSPSACWWPARV